MIKHIAIAIAMLILAAGCATGVRVAPERTTVRELTESPGFYNNSVVKVRGYAISRFEAHFVCGSLHDIDSGNAKACLWISPSAKRGMLAAIDPAEYHQKEIVIVGVFDKDMLGHGSAYGGAISPIRTRAVGTHSKGDVPAPPPRPSANKSFKPMPLRGTA